MGFGAWLARRGNVGGTARWAGNLYIKIKNQNSEATLDEIMSNLIKFRYSSESTSHVKEAFLKQIALGKVHGLLHLVTNILSHEAGFTENTAENRSLFMDIIQEELEKLNIPPNDIYKPRA